ncbi:MAG TPA: ABC transporter ATP-binding protein [Sulfolobales archaeon]|nr:ABC transporter ATP-binding protein [Sulfolobales archaeon]
MTAINREYEKLLIVRSLKKYFPSPRGIVRAVDDIDFEISYGETLALVGESGSGKTTTGHVIMGFYPPTSGNILFKDMDISMPLSKRPLKLKKELQIVFQDPGTSLNPKHTVKEIIELPLKIHKIVDKSEIYNRVIELLEYVGLGEDYLFKYPRELGGGEKQLVAIARALAVDPSFMVLDEPTSALDILAQAKVLNTLTKIQREKKLSYLLITHDLGVVRNVSHRTAVMYLGKIYEIAPTEELFKNPAHPYTQMLFSSIPTFYDEDEAVKPKHIESQGEIPSATNPPPGCRFHTRCPFAMDICKREDPPFIELEHSHYIKCWLYNKDHNKP